MNFKYVLTNSILRAHLKSIRRSFSSETVHNSVSSKPPQLTVEQTSLSNPPSQSLLSYIDKGYAPSKDFGEDYLLPHPIWKGHYVEKIKSTHRLPETFSDQLALYTIKAIRFNFDWMSGYSFGKLTPSKFLSRMIFLETVAAVPGAVGGTLRTLHSLRNMRRDFGWIHTLYEEAENERMHLLTAIQMKQPGLFFRICVLITQGLFFNFYWISYLISPKFCHRLVGYLEEEAVRTYTHCIEEIEAGHFWHDTPAPEIARLYWRLPENAKMLDLLLHIRADEAHHREVNHTFASLDADSMNPYKPGH